MSGRKRLEAIEIVFSLEEATSQSGYDSPFGAVVFQPRTGSLDSVDALRTIIEIMSLIGANSQFRERSSLVRAGTVLKKIQKSERWGHLQTDELDFQYGVVGSLGHCFIIIKEKFLNAAKSWQTWVEPFLEKNGFIQARVYDVDYDYWQNAADQSLYICAGKDFSKLPMRSNGAPYPLEAMVIDTSQNPGRRVIRMGYIEAVGAVMWFSPLFWDRVGQARKDRIVSSDWTNPAEIGSGSMRIQISECSFNSTDTGDAQNQLRAMIFG